MNHQGSTDGDDDMRAFSFERSYKDDSPTLLKGSGGGGTFSWENLKKSKVFWCCLAFFIIFFLILGVALGLAAEDDDDEPTQVELASPTVSTIAFGSCTAYNFIYQEIWEKAIIPSQPDAWIWAGDFSYLDDPIVNCNNEDNADTELWQQSCNCSNNFIAKRPHSCLAGDVYNAQFRWLYTLKDPGYSAFLNYMCPNAQAAGYWPPPGTDATLCPRHIIGVWDDHDSGWNNANERLPNRQIFKKMYLDAVGDAPDSPRRGAAHGMFYKYTLNEFAKGSFSSLYERESQSISRGTDLDPLLPLPQENIGVDVFLLDERYQREPLPCESRRDYCELVVAEGDSLSNNNFAWCDDFLNGGVDGEGTCCKKDEQLTAFCDAQAALAPSARDQYYEQLCNLGDPAFGTETLLFDEGLGTYVRNPGVDGFAEDLQADSPFCEVIGRRQRAWFRDSLSQSAARLKIVVSASVLIGNPDETPCSGSFSSATCKCSSDDMECYSWAKRELAYLIEGAQKPGESCAIVLTGDYHISDFRVIKPGVQPYSDAYDSAGWDNQVIQFMSSGLTNITAHGTGCHSWNADQLGLRADGNCGYVDFASFGLIQLLDANGNLVDSGADTIAKVRMQIVSTSRVVQYEQVLDMETCMLESTITS
uniref:PhoD-like phosphatase metallophosphatase domain-containing protein n=1 Tax=Pinguiococcus pyrenoidosus TaxID=172671 RepID=A0A7R9UFG7_9STRA|mmetsp:Transcript_8860/g.33462  ORF Transcript_8860/g.33462 Transcript_8860/m.33462 type:complete len:646 (+) Transcript_8860:166-2103(+)